jgi:hypothetical protein
MSVLNIPFYKNTKDNLHCVQACLKSVLKYYFPHKNYSFQYLDKVTYHRKNKWTWDFGMMLFLARLNFKVIYIADFDFYKFATLGEKYLIKIWSKDVYETQKKFSDFKQEQKLSRLVIKNRKIKLIKKNPTIDDINSLYKKEYLLLVSINPYSLDRVKGYASHLVVITNLTSRMITFHDPGLPPRPNRRVLNKNFEKAMDGTLIAIKK